MGSYKEKFEKVQELFSMGFILEEEFLSRKADLMAEFGLSEAAAEPPKVDEPLPVAEPTVCYPPDITPIDPPINFITSVVPDSIDIPPPPPMPVGGPPPPPPPPMPVAFHMAPVAPPPMPVIRRPVAEPQPPQPCPPPAKERSRPSRPPASTDAIEAHYITASNPKGSDAIVPLRRLSAPLVSDDDVLRLPAPGQCTAVWRSRALYVQTAPASGTDERALGEQLGLSYASPMVSYVRFVRPENLPPGPPDDEAERHRAYYGSVEMDVGHYEAVTGVAEGFVYARLRGIYLHRTRGPVFIAESGSLVGHRSEAIFDIFAQPAWCTLPEIPRVRALQGAVESDRLVTGDPNSWQRPRDREAPRTDDPFRLKLEATLFLRGLQLQRHRKGCQDLSDSLLPKADTKLSDAAASGDRCTICGEPIATSSPALCDTHANPFIVALWQRIQGGRLYTEEPAVEMPSEEVKEIVLHDSKFRLVDVASLPRQRNSLAQRFVRAVGSGEEMKYSAPLYSEQPAESPYNG